MKIVASNFEEVGKCSIDFQSFNHIIFGFVAYLVIFLLSSTFFNLFRVWGWICFISLLIGVMWEVLENILLTNAFFRIWGVDSLENSLMDIVFDVIGIIMACILSFFSWEVMLVVGFVITLILVFLMYVGMKLTQNKKD